LTVSAETGGNAPLGRDDPAGSPSLPRHERVWTPWRMRYVGGGAGEEGCIFCNRLAQNDDVAALILHRGERAFVIMNLFPYNAGHVMIMPTAHVASPEDVDPETTVELAALRGPVLRALRRALSCDGFNLGLNVGAVAGAGVTDHVHEHVVPRWQGDANFMPILAATMVMPELIPVTYAKLRAELARELTGQDAVTSVILSADGQTALVTADGELPTTSAAAGEPLWRAALRDARGRGARDPEITGWAGSALLIGATLSADSLAAGNRLEPIASLLTGRHGDSISVALRCLRASPHAQPDGPSVHLP
jgi:ATP adenylyltransferase